MSREPLARVGTKTRDREEATGDIDGPWVAMAQQGDVDAFVALYDRYYRRLLRHCTLRLGDLRDAEDAVQETFYRAWRGLPALRERHNFYAWLATIATNFCADQFRRRSRTTPVADIEPLCAEEAEEADELSSFSTDAAIVTTAISRLSPRHQRVLELREWKGCSYKEIAATEGIQLEAVKTLLWRARHALALELSALTSVDTRAAALVHPRSAADGRAGGATRVRHRVSGATRRVGADRVRA